MASSAHHGRWIREEAAMAAIAFNTVNQATHVREQLKTVLAAFRAMLDAFVSNRMRRAAAEAEHIRPRLPQGASSPNTR
jgi:vancomycin permeability regulator SanA